MVFKRKALSKEGARNSKMDWPCWTLIGLMHQFVSVEMLNGNSAIKT